MNPLKRKQICEITSRELQLPEEELEEIVSFYYDHLQSLMSKADDLAYGVPGLGVFVIVRKRLNSKIKKLECILEKMDETKSMRSYKLTQSMKHELEVYKRLVIKLEEEDEQRALTRERKQQFKNKQHDDLQEKRTTLSSN